MKQTNPNGYSRKVQRCTAGELIPGTPEFQQEDKDFNASRQGQHEDYNAKYIHAGKSPLTMVLKSARHVHTPALFKAYQRKRSSMEER
eukprot:5046093-Amphidinium_carterae.1